jgi:hypothetical protein
MQININDCLITTRMESLESSFIDVFLRLLKKRQK